MGTRGHLDHPDSTAAAVMQSCKVPTLAMRPGSSPKLDISRISLWARPRSQAPQAWDIASLLGSLLNSPVDMQALIRGGSGPVHCAMDALLVLDLPRFQNDGLACTLEEEHCRVLLVAPPAPGTVQ
jgi:hypothetical protein